MGQRIAGAVNIDAVNPDDRRDLAARWRDRLAAITAEQGRPVTRHGARPRDPRRGHDPQPSWPSVASSFRWRCPMTAHPPVILRRPHTRQVHRRPGRDPVPRHLDHDPHRTYLPSPRSSMTSARQRHDAPWLELRCAYVGCRYVLLVRAEHAHDLALARDHRRRPGGPTVPRPCSGSVSSGASSPVTDVVRDQAPHPALAPPVHHDDRSIR